MEKEKKSIASIYKSEPNRGNLDKIIRKTSTRNEVTDDYIEDIRDLMSQGAHIIDQKISFQPKKAPLRILFSKRNVNLEWIKK